METLLPPKLQKQDKLRRDILKQLYYGGKLSLNELSGLTSKSLPVVGNIVNMLVDEGYVKEHGLAPSTGGRRPVKFSLSPDRDRYLLSVGMDQLVTRIAIFDLSNQIKGSIKSQSIDLSKDPNALTKLVTFIDRTIKESGIQPKQLLGIGIGMPGFINVEKGINHTFFTNVKGNLREYLSSELNLPVFIDNDSTSIALAELKFGAARGLKNVMVVNIGWGIGLGMVVNGSLFKGHSGYGGEFSHIPISKTDNLCSCGKRGCLEVDASLLVVAQKAKEAVAEGAKSSLEHLFSIETKLPGEALIEAASQGDPLAVSLLSESAFMIGKGLATLIHIMNPERIVLSGRGAEADNILLAPISHALNEFCIPKLMENTEIVVSKLAHSAELFGAATLVVENCHFK